MNITISSGKEVWKLERRENEFLFSYLFRFDQKQRLNLLNNNIEIGGNLLIELKSYFEQALLHLLADCYSEPSMTTRQKHPTRFEKFSFRNKKYTVDYTLSLPGRLIYTLFLRIVFIDRLIQNEEKLKLSWLE